ncbi:MAG: hypothetical protein KIS72_11615, partial [Luteimonas sp.]|nr:hypothetical protein [Luteimonas sp.]
MATHVCAGPRDDLIANVHRNWQSQSPPGSIDRRVWPQSEPARIVALLADAAQPARHAAHELLAQMQAHPWRILGSTHEGGSSDADAHATDPCLHLTVQVNARKLRLRCRRAP